MLGVTKGFVAVAYVFQEGLAPDVAMRFFLEARKSHVGAAAHGVQFVRTRYLVTLVASLILATNGPRRRGCDDG